MGYFLIILGLAMMAYDAWRWFGRRRAPVPVAGEVSEAPLRRLFNIIFFIFGAALIVLGWAIMIPEPG